MSKVLERDLRKEIDELKSREEEIRKLRQEKEAELREIYIGARSGSYRLEL